MLQGWEADNIPGRNHIIRTFQLAPPVGSVPGETTANQAGVVCNDITGSRIKRIDIEGGTAVMVRTAPAR
ncbi:hypothetical protein [Ferrimonas sediminum]|uniref:hypothetical protein n=1 Tax=Ferrimonas sediminum TaxID=718193 RepID=UPI000B84CB47|nr:hypothetical protein [Ferrimonas sediminum]